MTDGARDQFFRYSATLHWGKEKKKSEKVDILVLH